MKKLLSFMLSLGLATISPALNAVQMPEVQSNSSGWQAAKKWFRSGGNIKALTRQEKKAFKALKKKIGISALVAGVVALLGGLYGGIWMASQETLSARSRAAGIAQNLILWNENPTLNLERQLKTQISTAIKNIIHTPEQNPRDLVWNNVLGFLIAREQNEHAIANMRNLFEFCRPQ